MHAVVVVHFTPPLLLCHDAQALLKRNPGFVFCLERSVKVLDPAGHVSIMESRTCSGHLFKLERLFSDLSTCQGSKQ